MCIARQISKLLSKWHTRILLNVGEVHWIDTAGLAYIMAGLTSARKRNGDLKLLNPKKNLQMVLQITRMLSVLEVSHYEAAAIKSFAEIGER